MSTAIELGACAVLRDEAENIREWIAFHALAGVQRFLLYDDGSTDDIEERLADLVAADLVDLRRWDRPRPNQVSAYNHALDRARGKMRWLAFVDVDEYVLPLRATSLREVLGEYEEAAALVAYWRTFGSNGYLNRPKVPTIEAYTRCCPADPSLELNRHFKSIVNVDHTLCSAGNPHQFIHTAAQPVDEAWNVPSVGDAVPSWDHLAIHHYRTRSRSECEAKCRRGRADVRSSNTARSWPDFFLALDAVANAVENRAALEFLARASAELPAEGPVAELVQEQYGATLRRQAAGAS